MASCCQEECSEDILKEYSATTSTNQQVFQGYDYEFVPPLESKYECAICLMCQKDPIQTSCGHRFCRECILMWIRNESRRCPEDNCPLTEENVFPDNFAKREITNLKIRCPNSKNGCNAIIELGTIEEHRRICEFETISCPNRCPVMILQQDVHDHITKECLHRIIDCSLCYAKFQLDQQQSHFEICPMVSIPCQHCGENLPRQDHFKHLHNDCPIALVMCPFADIGCDVVIHPELMQEHLATYVHKHLRFLSTAYNHLYEVIGKLAAPQDNGLGAAGGTHEPFKTIRDAFDNLKLNAQHQESPKNEVVERKVPSVDEGLLKELFQRNIQLEQRHREQEIKYEALNKRLSEVEAELAFLREQKCAMEGRFCNGVFVWKVPGISSLVAEATQTGHNKLLHSPGFYTGAFGYKLCIRTNVVVKSAATFLSLFVHFMQGDYDDTLEWPFKGVITLALVETAGSDRQSNQIVEKMATKPGLAAFQRPTSERNPKGFGFTEFVSIDILNRGFFLTNDCLTVRAIVTLEPNVQYD